MFHHPALPAILAFVATFLAVLVLRPVAGRLGWVDRPGGRKTHAAATPMIGGLAIVAGTAPWALMMFELTPAVLGFGLAAAVVVLTGILDDLFDLKWPIRLLAQASAGLIIVYVGGVKVEMIGPMFGIHTHSLGILSTPFTVLATVGIINAINMADGIDGLAGSVTVCALVMIIVAAMQSDNTRLAYGLFIVLGGVLGFLAFNMRVPGRDRAKIFLGNAGSEFLGLMIAWSCFRLTQNPDHPVTPALAPFLVAVPIIDCLVVMVRRLRNGRSPFSADRNHLHHILLDAGLRTTSVVVVISALSVAFGFFGFAALDADIPVAWLVVTFVVISLAYYLASARRQRCVAFVAGLARLGQRGRHDGVAEPPAPPAGGDTSSKQRG
jgi:UDP-GlcNAc:undecaprenyl-phosphate GlcNAc-1-phosphate transferase